MCSCAELEHRKMGLHSKPEEENIQRSEAKKNHGLDSKNGIEILLA